MSPNSYLISYILPETEPDQGFLKALQAMAQDIGAELLLGTGKYWRAGQEQDLVFAESAKPYICNKRLELYGGKAIFHGDRHVSCTSANPLTVLLETGNALNIVPHAKSICTVVPSGSKWPSVNVTTTAICPGNYSDSVAGHTSRDRHCLGAILLHGAGSNKFHMRHLMWKKEEIHDAVLGVYNASGFVRDVDPEYIVLSDIHTLSAHKPHLDRALGLLDKLHPKSVLVGDLIDFDRYSHHNPFCGVGGHSLRVEITAAAKFLTKLFSRADDVIVLNSNHHDHISQWIERWKKPGSGEELIDFAWALNAYATHGPGKVFEALIFDSISRDYYHDLARLHFPSARENWTSSKGVEIFHGHFGANGSRSPSVAGLAKLGVATVTGHRHTPGWKDHAYGVGVMPRNQDVGYTKGLSSWLHADCVGHSNNARQLLLDVDGMGI